MLPLIEGRARADPRSTKEVPSCRRANERERCGLLSTEVMTVGEGGPEVSSRVTLRPTVTPSDPSPSSPIPVIFRDQSGRKFVGHMSYIRNLFGQMLMCPRGRVWRLKRNGDELTSIYLLPCLPQPFHSPSPTFHTLRRHVLHQSWSLPTGARNYQVSVTEVRLPARLLSSDPK